LKRPILKRNDVRELARAKMATVRVLVRLIQVLVKDGLRYTRLIQVLVKDGLIKMVTIHRLNPLAGSAVGSMFGT
jgi:hypothetical protein